MRSGFPCKHCDSDRTKILHTFRRWKGKRVTKRRHICLACKWRFNTFAIFEERFKELLACEKRQKSCAS